MFQIYSLLFIILNFYGKIVHIIYRSSPLQRLRENMIGKKIKKLALISGWDDWKRCTNYGLRALGVTSLDSSKEHNLTNKAVLNHSRHANTKSQKPYLRETVTNKSTLQDGLIGKIESEKDSDFRDLKRKFDDLEN